MPRLMYPRLTGLLGVAGLLNADPAPHRTSAEITADDRGWWSFQPVRAPAVPDPLPAPAGSPFSIRTGIDAFVQARSQATGGTAWPAEEEKPALLRRVTFDLIGLPPTPMELDAFLADASPDAYEKVIDRLLASRHYGEKWARHWLDLVRYAESDGYKQDAGRPDAWRYRDYVIASFNEDKPYDRFVQEQLAGDELFPGDPVALVATGFYRACVYEYNNRDTKTQWAAILAETTDTVGDVFLGLGMQCARCHNHKFDPLQQEDYYRLQACFAGMIWRDDVSAATPVEIANWRQKNAAWEQANAATLRALADGEAPFRKKLTDDALDKFPKEIEAVWRRGPAQWTPAEQPWMDFVSRQMVEACRDLAPAMNAEQKKQWRALKDAVAAAEASRPAPLPKALTVADSGPTAPPTFLPGTRREVPPGFLTVLGKEDAKNGRRRAALAEWLTRPDHPLTARVVVNRLWQEHFGRGLVATPSDFGRLGEKPSDPALLDWLAAEFVRGGWKFKPVHRLIVTSTAYRLAGEGNGDWWRAPQPRRLAAEQIRDASLVASGELNSEAGGPSATADQPRRSVYTRVLRNTPDPLLQSFDTPDGFRSAGTRQPTTTPIQSLLMVNGPWMHQRAKALARRLREDYPGLRVEPVRQAYRRTLSREATSEEIAEGLWFVQSQTALSRKEMDPPPPDSAEVPAAELAALADFCHALLNSSEFLYVD